MSAHTTGEWVRGNGADAGKSYAICAGTRIVARVVGTGYPFGIGSSPESDANARLIAAAPDLLAALCRLVEMAEPAMERNGMHFGCWNAARAAIAKTEAA